MMTMRYIAVGAVALITAVALLGTPAEALSMKECSAKYKEAKEAGTLNGMKWNDFRKAQCAPRRLVNRHLPRHRQKQRHPPSLPLHQHRWRLAMPHFLPLFLPSIRASPQARRACIPVLINTGPTKQTAEMADLNGSRRVVAITVSATSA